MSFVLSLTIAIALGALIGWQSYLVATNQTTIEFLHNRTQTRRARSKGETFINPYDQGFKTNFTEFFDTGASWWLFAFPTMVNSAASKKYEPLDQLV
eukprot:gene4280-4996_t